MSEKITIEIEGGDAQISPALDSVGLFHWLYGDLWLMQDAGLHDGDESNIKDALAILPDYELGRLFKKGVALCRQVTDFMNEVETVYQKAITDLNKSEGVIQE